MKLAASYSAASEEHLEFCHTSLLTVNPSDESDALASFLYCVKSKSRSKARRTLVVK